MTNYASFSALIDEFASQASLAKAIGVEAPTVRMWKYRDRLPAEHFSAVVEAARAEGIAGVSFELLYSLAGRAPSAGKAA